MSNFTSVDQALQFAIDREQEAIEFYSGLAGKATGAGMQEVFKGFAAEEAKHKSKLLSIKQGGQFKPAEQKVADMKIADYLAEVQPSADMDLQAALTVAMQREKKAYLLYRDLAATVAGGEFVEVFNALAQEEAGHKLYLETMYDEVVLTEN